MRKTIAGLLVAVVVALAAVVAVPSGLVGLVMLIASDQRAGGAGGCYGSGTGLDDPGSVGGLTAEQTANLQVIVQTVATRGLSGNDAVIAVMTALTESSLVNVDHGDTAGPDSRGLFQQRASWGPYEVRMDPAGSTGLFLDAMTSPGLKVYGSAELVNVADGSRLLVAPWIVAQSVQRSAFSDGSNYRAKYERAIALVRQAAPAGMVVGPSPWSSSDGAGSIPVQVGTGGDTPAVGCGGGLDLGGGDRAAGAWGGHSNGKIPVDQLAAIPWSTGQFLRADAVNALVEMNSAYRATFGKDISITDSYRSFEAQVRVKAEKGWLAATPGTSNHGWALALDLGGGINKFGTPEHAWMVENAPRWGWVHPPWARQNGSKPEAWHWEFNGRTQS